MMGNCYEKFSPVGDIGKMVNFGSVYKSLVEKRSVVEIGQRLIFTCQYRSVVNIRQMYTARC